jgi:hypothetical protein
MESEELLQFIWKKGLFLNGNMFTTCGKRLEIFNPGESNFHAGPDFFNARIKIGSLIWAGNIEVHLRASDWNKHGHNSDPAYNNVILHVVREPDQESWNQLGYRIPMFKMDYPSHLQSLYQTMLKSDRHLLCKPFLKVLNSSRLSKLLEDKLHERIGRKTDLLKSYLYQRGHGREESLFRLMGMGFGLPVNALPFEMLVSMIPYNLIYELRDDLADLEALLFGHSGLLESGTSQSIYIRNLKNRYQQRHLMIKGKPLPSHLWKFLRLRPASFPTIRISQFASLIHQRSPWSGFINSFPTLSELEQWFRVKASPYWDNHYHFGSCSPVLPKNIGSHAFQMLLINVVVPFLNALGEMEHQRPICDYAFGLLKNLGAESNHIMEIWAKFGIHPTNAWESQALIQLYNTYCKQKRCLDCQIGVAIFTGAGNEKQQP